MHLSKNNEGNSEHNVILSRFENWIFPSCINWTYQKGCHINSQGHRTVVLVVYVLVKQENFTVLFEKQGKYALLETTRITQYLSMNLTSIYPVFNLIPWRLFLLWERLSKGQVSPPCGVQFPKRYFCRGWSELIRYTSVRVTSSPSGYATRNSQLNGMSTSVNNSSRLGSTSRYNK